jgi:hypothetical protein
VPDGLTGFKFGMSQQAVRDLALMALADLLRARTEWDEPPALLFAYFEDGAVRISDRSLVPSWMWEKGPPTLVLEHLANGVMASPVQKVMAAVAPETFFGVAWRSEAWMASAPVRDTEAVESLNRAAQRRQIKNHPARVECRNVWAMTRVGMLWAQQVRGSDEVDSRPARKKDIEGTVPDALTTMFRAVVSKSAAHP